ncbi:MAG: protease pro-enzyme activation domain-containing protein, partial [Gemmatimonadales bacterium]
SSPAGQDQSSRISGDWHSSATEPLPAGRQPEFHAGLDLGIAPANTRLDRMLLLLEPLPAQQRALDGFLQAQLTSGNCAYHQWLTPAQFADRFSNSASDVSTVAGWLAEQGFSVAPLPAGRGWIEFSGTAAQVEQAFGAAVHGYSTTAGTRYTLTNSIRVPAVFVPLIRGLVSLDGALSVPALTTLQAVATTPSALAGISSPGQAEALTPELLAPILHLDALHASGVTGAGESIAIASRSNIQAADIAAFRATFGLPAGTVSVAPNGHDPGLTADQAEAELAASWAGAAAPDAKIVVVPSASTAATDGVDLSLAAIVDQDRAHTLVVDFSSCEAALNDAHVAFYAAIYRQASAEGIAAIAASGDSGAAACHAPGSSALVSSGLAVN